MNVEAEDIRIGVIVLLFSLLVPWSCCGAHSQGATREINDRGPLVAWEDRR